MGADRSSASRSAITARSASVVSVRPRISTRPSTTVSRTSAECAVYASVDHGSWCGRRRRASARPRSGRPARPPPASRAAPRGPAAGRPRASPSGRPARLRPPSGRPPASGTSAVCRIAPSTSGELELTAPSVPSRTVTPALSSRGTGAIPQPGFRSDTGQRATAVSVRAGAAPTRAGRHDEVPVHGVPVRPQHERTVVEHLAEHGPLRRPPAGPPIRWDPPDRWSYAHGGTRH